MTDESTRGAQRARALEADRVVYRMTTMLLGSTVIIIVVGIVLLRMAVLWKGGDAAHAVPESLVAIASTAVGALAGLLSPLGGRTS